MPPPENIGLPLIGLLFTDVIIPEIGIPLFIEEEKKDSTFWMFNMNVIEAYENRSSGF